MIEQIVPRAGTPILIVGVGSIGQRHLRNLKSLGYTNLAATDTNPDRIASVSEHLGITTFTDLETAVDQFQPQMVLVCTPPALHVEQACIALEANAHIFIEKPLSHTLEDVDKLAALAEERQRVIQVGYNLRHHPVFQRVKTVLDAHEIGQIQWARLEIGQYLPDWRPQIDYRQNYTARRELGGGILLDASHEIDLALWFLGQPTVLCCMAGNLSALEVNVEDSASILARFESGAQADIHLDFIQRGYHRNGKITGSAGWVSWDFPMGMVSLYRGDAKTTEVLQFPPDMNTMYIQELQVFLETSFRNQFSLDSLTQAVQILRFVRLARQSSEERKWLDFA
ncbi:MAG: Gfo/Idh/MocA family oxidoreductase [Anaerolineae bacterium]|nr:Gfo/Idh/MocA family oxidoreductase [Anaerolineae bacterium]NUQ07146.1 Gfo/Idh/MocA family oxidoreductase [Anaerolineae bacterium]